ncbi:MAG: hypothetical protein JWP65_3024 [Ramlibacter sp.]|jgi:hypothetical protein|uniref:hypothetical protein n=1 Tax=Ramlibacter sp. TaxID=1917967 RepID=UPI002618B142|nr:hypothetical protein [Ramlibacter sp.]MDB5752603.1 hypothetical protein [Ramlibacter sp.]
MANAHPLAPPAQPGDPIDLTSSVAGEEDPGASIDLADAPAFPMQRPQEGADKTEDRPDGA